MGVIPFYNTWVHNNVKIVDDTIHNEMILHLSNGNRPKAKMIFETKEYLDESGLDTKLEQVLIPLKFLYAIAVIGGFFLFPHIPMILAIISLLLIIVAIAIHVKWYYKKMYEKYKYHFIKTRQVRDKDKEIIEIEKLIKQYGN